MERSDWRAGGGIFSAGPHFLRRGWIDLLNIARVDPGGVQNPHGDVQPDGSQDKYGKDSRDYLSDLLHCKDTLGRGV